MRSKRETAPPLSLEEYVSQHSDRGRLFLMLLWYFLWLFRPNITREDIIHFAKQELPSDLEKAVRKIERTAIGLPIAFGLLAGCLVGCLHAVSLSVLRGAILIALTLSAIVIVACGFVLFFMSEIEKQRKYGQNLIAKAARESAEESAREAQDDVTKPTDCISCGATIPEGQTKCGKCGWSYRE